MQARGVRACVHVFVRACVYVFVCANVCVHQQEQENAIDMNQRQRGRKAGNEQALTVRVRKTDIQ